MAVLTEWSLDTCLIGRRVEWFDQVDSTNTVAAAHADDPTHEGLVIVADVQTAGRGRQGRTWLSPPGDGLLLSVLLFPPERLRRPAILTTLAAVAVCETIHARTGLHGAIKWPNDVLLCDRKVCGVLIEQGRGTVLGIGLNVNTPAAVFAENQLPQAASLQVFAGRPLEREAVLRTLLGELDRSYHDLLKGEVGGLEARWRRHSNLVGREVVVQAQRATYRGRLLELAFDGIVLEETDGPFRQWAPEAVEHITPVP